MKEITFMTNSDTNAETMEVDDELYEKVLSYIIEADFTVRQAAELMETGSCFEYNGRGFWKLRWDGTHIGLFWDKEGDYAHQMFLFKP